MQRLNASGHYVFDNSKELENRAGLPPTRFLNLRNFKLVVPPSKVFVRLQVVLNT